MDIIVEIRSNKRFFPEIVTSPRSQLKQLTKEISQFLSLMLSSKDYKIKHDDIYVSLNYNFTNYGDGWELINNMGIQKGIPFKDLLGNPKSTIYYLMYVCKSNFVFFNRKQEAKVKGYYEADEYDVYEDKAHMSEDERKLLGSILCKRIVVNIGGNREINAVLSICTYNKSFVKVGMLEYTGKVSDEDVRRELSVRENLKNYLSEFEVRLHIELCLQYISFLHDNISVK